MSLGLFLSFQLFKHLNVGETKAAEIAGLMIGRSGLIFIIIKGKYLSVCRVNISVVVWFGKMKN